MVVSRARLPPHGANPAWLRVRTVSSHDCVPDALYPPGPPNPASAPAITRPPTNSLIVFAPTDRLGSDTCDPSAGLKNVAVQLFPPPGASADRFAFRLFPRSPATRSMTAR